MKTVLPAREAGHPEPDGRVEPVLPEVHQRAGRQPDLFDELVHNQGLPSVARSRGPVKKLFTRGEARLAAANAVRLPALLRKT